MLSFVFLLFRKRLEVRRRRPFLQLFFSADFFWMRVQEALLCFRLEWHLSVFVLVAASLLFDDSFDFFASARSIPRRDHVFAVHAMRVSTFFVAALSFRNFGDPPSVLESYRMRNAVYVQPAHGAGGNVAFYFQTFASIADELPTSAATRAAGSSDRLRLEVQDRSLGIFVFSGHSIGSLAWSMRETESDAERSTPIVGHFLPELR
jgi:hypothetical protein